MKVEVVEKSLTGRELMFEVDKEKVSLEKTNIIKDIKKEAVIEGFRKGKAPEKIIELKFADLIKENLLKKFIPDLYFEAIKEKKLTTVIEPSVYDVQLDDEGLKFKIYTEIKPDVKINKYKNIPVKKRQPEAVTEEQVEKVLTQWEKKPEFSASIIDPSKRRAWKEKIRKQLEDYSKMQASAQEEEELWAGVIKETNFQVPEKLLEQRAIKYTEDYFNNIDVTNKTEEEKQKIAKEVFEKVKPIAETDLKKYFILDMIAQLENIEVTSEDVAERIDKVSRSYGEPLEKLKENLEKTGSIENLKDEIRIDKSFDFLKKNSQIIEKVILPGEEKRIQTK